MKPTSSTLHKAVIALFKSFVLLFSFCIASASLSAQNCTINAGIGESLCPGSSINLNGSIGGSFDPATVQWQVVSQPPGASAVITNPKSLLTPVPVTVPGTYTFSFSATCALGGVASDNVSYVVGVMPSTPTISTGSGNPTSFSCYAGAPISLTGKAPAAGETVSWQVIGSKGNFSAPTEASSTFTPSFSEEECASTTPVTIRYTISNASGCSNSIIRTLNFQRNYGVANATAQPTNICGNSTNLMGSCPGNGTVSWTMVSAPAGAPAVSFSSSTSRNTGVSNLTTGNYVFRYTIATGCSIGTADVNVTVAGSSPLTPANAGNDQYFCDVPSLISLNGNLPAAGETVSWSQVAGGAGVVLGSSGSPNTTVTGLTNEGAPYTFAYNITNGICSATDTLRIYKISTEATLTGADISSCDPSANFINIANFGTYSFNELDTIETSITLLSGPGSASVFIRKAIGGGANPISLTPSPLPIAIGETKTYKIFGADLYLNYPTPSSSAYSELFDARLNGLAGTYKFNITVTTRCQTFQKEVTITADL